MDHPPSGIRDLEQPVVRQSHPEIIEAVEDKDIEL